MINDRNGRGHDRCMIDIVIHPLATGLDLAYSHADNKGRFEDD